MALFFKIQIKINIFFGATLKKILVVIVAIFMRKPGQFKIYNRNHHHNNSKII